MPNEKKKRGRREEKKRKRTEYDEGAYPAQKQNWDGGEGGNSEIVPDNGAGLEPQAYNDTAGSIEAPFYGLLDEEEQAYFKRADNLLELNQFADDEERGLFLASVYREANGKELKIACSQSCSRFLERLIRVSTPKQLKALFLKFGGHFLNLVQHRFASHCCEALFTQSAPIVTQELVAHVEEREEKTPDGDISASMESLFISVVKELEGNLGYLMTDNFASHTLRRLFVVLAGRPLSDTATTSLLQSKRKETVDVPNWKNPSMVEQLNSRTVPESFQTALDEMISGTTANLDTNYLRALATHPIGNPVLQLLMELEFSRSGKSKVRDEVSLFRRLLPDDPLTEGTESASFVKGLLYDPVGSRLLETIVQSAPGKVFKVLYRSLFRENLTNLVRNDIASFVVCRVLERLSHDDLQQAVDQICPQIPLLIERSRTSIIKVLIERCHIRQVNTQAIADILRLAYGEPETSMLFKMLKPGSSDIDGMSRDRRAQLEAQDSDKLHGSLIAQAMLIMPGPLRDMVMTNILAMNGSSLMLMAKDKTATHVLQNALTCQGQPKSIRRKIVQKLVGHMTELALDPIASHVVDTCWTATEDLIFIREGIADELQQDESVLRDSFSGRAVWRNWMMDMYKRRRTDWISKTKWVSQAQEPVDSTEKRPAARAGKSAIELARERFAASKDVRRRIGMAGNTGTISTHAYAKGTKT